LQKDHLIRQDLILAYDRAVDERDKYGIPDWKKRERQRFLELLHAEGKSSLIDVGSGPGTHAVYFQEHGIDVTCIDLSPRNVEKCKNRGLEAFVCDAIDLKSLGRTFDAAFAMNSLLHVPRTQLPKALSSIRDTLNPAGLFYWGQYGGEERQGVYEEDKYEPKRFFSLLNDEQIREEASQVFGLDEFMSVSPEDSGSLHFQSLILRVEGLFLRAMPDDGTHK